MPHDGFDGGREAFVSPGSKSGMIKIRESPGKAANSNPRNRVANTPTSPTATTAINSCCLWRISFRNGSCGTDGRGHAGLEVTSGRTESSQTKISSGTRSSSVSAVSLRRVSCKTHKKWELTGLCICGALRNAPQKMLVECVRGH